MYPRGIPDIGWKDLLLGLADCIRNFDTAQTQADAEQAFGAQSLACLTVRSGFDLALQALALPPGSEVIVSAVTIPDMLHIIERHGLVAVPVDLDMQQLAVDPGELERAIGERSRVVLVAHLFGSRMPIGPLAAICRRHGLVLLEDCAQAYSGDSYRGHPESDVAMFSYGPIKTNTALGGALLRFRNPDLLARARAIQTRYPLQPRLAYARRIGLFMALRALANPAALNLFVIACRLRGYDADAILSSSMRTFGKGELFVNIRRRPCGPLLRTLTRRLRRPNHHAVGRRIGYARRLLASLPRAAWPGSESKFHVHWILPVVDDDPVTLTALLRSYGYDATQKASSLCVVGPAAGRPAAGHAVVTLAHMLYLPVYPTMPERAVKQLAQIVAQRSVAATSAGMLQGAAPARAQS